MYSLNDIKSWFKTGKFPTEDQFAKAWESFWHKAEKVNVSAIEGLQNILSAKADRDMVDSQVNDLRQNKENVGVAKALTDAHANASDAHQALFDLKANEADVYPREVIDSWFAAHEGDEELHFTDEEKIKLTNLGKFVSGLAVTPSSDGSKRLDLVVNAIDPQVAATSVSESLELPLVSAGCNGLMSPGQKSVVDGLSQGNAVLNVMGTPSSTWQLSSTSGPKLKNSGNVFELRNAADSAYSDLTLNNLTIKGNVVQEGSSFITNAETVEAKDNLILLNKGEAGAGVTKGVAGLEIDRGTQENYKIVFDESDDRFKAGTGSDLWPILLRDNEASLTGGALLSWDAAAKRAKTRREGAGSGLDADLLDGKQGSEYALKTDLTAISWEYITSKPATATRWPSWEEITNRPAIPVIPSLTEAAGSGTGYLLTGVSGHTVSRRAIADGDIPASIARTSQIPSLTGYATQSWVQSKGYITSVPAQSWTSITGKPAFAVVATSGSYNDLLNKPTIPAAYSLPAATAAVLGGVKIGGNITNSGGVISLTKDNVVAALGYTPPTTDTNTHYVTRSFVGSGTAANAATTNGNTKLVITDDSTVRTSHIIRGTGGTTVSSDASGNIIINSTSSSVDASTVMAAINSQSEITFTKHVICTAGAGTASTSDIRFKKNLREIPPVLDWVLNAPEFIYNWEDEQTDSLGTSAQYWEDKIGTLVGEIGDERRTKTFSYERYVMILQKALKEEHMLRVREKCEFEKRLAELENLVMNNIKPC